MTKRSPISTTKRVKVFKDHAGICHICRLPIVPGQSWEVSHPKPIAMGGADDETNMAPAHKSCHRDLTAVNDLPEIARAKRQEARHIGAAEPKAKIESKPFPKSGPKRAPRPSLPPRQLYISKGHAS